MLFEEKKNNKNYETGVPTKWQPASYCQKSYRRIFLPLLLTQPSSETKYGVKYTRFRQSENIVVIVPGDTCILPAQLSVGNRRGI